MTRRSAPDGLSRGRDLWYDSVRAAGQTAAALPREHNA
jgi:hypothetical protein